MLFVDNQNITDPRRNLALEEFLLRQAATAEPILLFYINQPAVIIGRNQNTLEEIDPDYVKENGVHVVRRLSGGGAVYHDLGNLNFSFITQGKGDLHDFAKFTAPVIRVLRELGVPAELRGKSDIFANGKKVSGNAQYASGNRMFSHGTILFDANIEHMLLALNPQHLRIESKAVQSVRSFVANIRELLPELMDIHQLRQAILRGVFGTDDPPLYKLSDADWRRVARLVAQRYDAWEWNYGRSPHFNVRKSEQTPAGVVDVRIDVDKGLVQGIKFYGSFTGTRDVAELERRLAGMRYDRDALTAVLSETDVTLYFEGLTSAELIELLY